MDLCATSGASIYVEGGRVSAQFDDEYPSQTVKDSTSIDDSDGDINNRSQGVTGQRAEDGRKWSSIRIVFASQ